MHAEDAFFLLLAALPSLVWIGLAVWAACKGWTRLGLWLLSLPGPLLLLLLAFDWIVWDVLFIMDLFLVLNLWALLALSMLVSIILLFVRGNARKPIFYLPLICGLAAILLARFFPFYMVNFTLFRAEREKVAQQIYTGNLRMDPEHHGDPIVLPPGERAISAGGTVDLKSEGDEIGVYFYYMRGLGGESTGFLYLKSDVAPSAADFESIKKVVPHWYLVSIE